MFLFYDGKDLERMKVWVCGVCVYLWGGDVWDVHVCEVCAVNMDNPKSWINRSSVETIS